MDNDIKSVVLAATAYGVAMLLCIIAGNAVLAFGLMCSALTVVTFAVFESDENRRLRRRLRKYKRAVDKLAEKEVER